jgi:hypothetical protein
MEELIQRVRGIIDICWGSFSAKVGGSLIDINKEASMQLNFAYLLKNTVDLALHHDDEIVEIELETGIPINKRMRECDIVIKILKGEDVCFLPIEMKCYKYLASSGGKRGAVDIFYKDVYADLELLEAYAKVRNFLPGIQLTMTDFRNLPYPPKRSGKYLDYDITHGALVSDGVHLTTPIGGKQIEIRLCGTYHFDWGQVGNFYFLKLENRSN